MDILAFLDLSSSAMLFGLIWTVQRLHYPSFSYISQKSFIDFEQFHCQRITPIVAPMMLTELCLSLYLFWSQGGSLRLINLFLVTFIWTITYLVSVPCHQKLELGYDQQVMSRLLWSNSLRSLAWSLKLLILGVIYVSI